MQFLTKPSFAWVRSLGKRSLMLLLSSIKSSLGDQIGLILHNSLEASQTSLALQFVSQIVISTGPLNGKPNHRSKRTTFLSSSAVRVDFDPLLPGDRPHGAGDGPRPVRAGFRLALVC